MINGPAGPEDDADDAVDLAPGTRSEVSGVVHGFSVQARDITGGLHVHQPMPQRSPPSQLPAAVRLTGRSADLAAMDAARARRIIVVTGPPGIGKTSLAIYWGHKVRDEYPDGVIYEDLHGYAPDGPSAPTETLGRFLRAFGLDPQRVPAELADLTSAYRSLTSDKRILLVLDDALTAAQVLPLLPPSAESLTIVTSRKRLGALAASGARIVQLDRLQAEAAVELLSDMIGDTRTLAEPHAARELVQLCGRFPLAICVCGARLAARPRSPISDMVEALTQERRRLAALTLEGDMAVRSSLEVSYQALPRQSARMYRVAGLYPGTRFGIGIVAAGTELPGDEARQLLEGLTDANLIEDETGGYFRFFDLTRLHAVEKAEQEESAAARTIAIRRMLDWLLTAVTIAGQTLTPYRHDQPREIRYPPAEPPRFAGPAGALDWLEVELPEVIAAARFAAGHGEPNVSWQLADAMWPVFLYRGHHAERLEFDQLGLDAARAAGDGPGEAKMLSRLGLAQLDLGRLDDADTTFRLTLAAWNAMGNARRAAGCLRRLGFVATARRRHTDAIEYFRKAMSAYRELNENRHVALTLIDLGEVLTDADQTAEAIAALQKAGTLLDRDADPYNAARLLIMLGRTHERAGQRDIAASRLNEALDAMRNIGSDRGQAQALESLGLLAENQGLPGEARNRYVQAHVILVKLGSPRAAEVAGHVERLGGT